MRLHGSSPADTKGRQSWNSRPTLGNLVAAAVDSGNFAHSRFGTQSPHCPSRRRTRHPPICFRTLRARTPKYRRRRSGVSEHIYIIFIFIIYCPPVVRVIFIPHAAAFVLLLAVVGLTLLAGSLLVVDALDQLVLALALALGLAAALSAFRRSLPARVLALVRVPGQSFGKWSSAPQPPQMPGGKPLLVHLSYSPQPRVPPGGSLRAVRATGAL